jgi:hypothetical protein
MIPAIADATARVDAPGTPADSKSGAKARPVAGPPVRVTDPLSTPNSGCIPRSDATAAPSAFCSTATMVHRTVKTSTCGPPTRSSEKLAPNPMVVKKAIISGA